MGRNRFVQPTVRRVPLTDGDWIDIKNELNAGENRRVFARIVKDMRPGVEMTMQPEMVGLTKIVEYLVDWSFLDAKGHKVEVSESAILNLDLDTYTEITNAIDAHETEMEAERAARKKSPDGMPTSEVISALPG